MATSDDKDAANSRLAARLREIAQPFLDEASAELVDLEVKGHPGSRVVRFFVDRDEGMDIDTCAQLSRRIERVLDDEDTVSGRYTLQVTSPGVDRPLRSGRDFARNVGRDVVLVRRVEADAPREVAGTVLQVDDDSVTLEIDGDRVPVALTEVDHARVQLPW